MSLYNPGSAHVNFGSAAGELGVEMGWEIINASRIQPPADEDAQMTALITNLVSEDIGEALEDYSGGVKGGENSTPSGLR